MVSGEGAGADRIPTGAASPPTAVAALPEALSATTLADLRDLRPPAGATPAATRSGPAVASSLVGSTYVVRSDVQYRAGPGLSSRVLGFLMPGQRISVVGEEGGWLAFHFPDEPDQKPAWVSRYFLAPAQAARH
jgi:hypothetical protein